MTALFVILLFVSIIALIVGLIKPSLLKQSSRKRVGLIFGGIAVVCFVLVGITAPKNPSSAVHTAGAAQTTRQTSPMPSQTGSKAAPAPVATGSVPVSPTLEQKITSDIKTTYAEGDATLISVEQSKDDSTVTVTFNVTKDIIDPTLFKEDAAALAAQTFQDVYAVYPSAPMVTITLNGNKVDQYGNTSNGALIGYYLTKATYAKFNWSGFDTNTLCDVLRQSEAREQSTSAAFLDGCTIYASNLQ